MPTAAANAKRASVHYHFFTTDTFRAANIPILGLRLELLPRSRRREAVELLAEAFWGNRKHFRMILRRLAPFEECQAIALVDDTLGLIAIAVVEALHSTKPHGDYKILYVHAFVVRADLRKRPGLKLGEKNFGVISNEFRSRFIAALLELAAFHSFHSMIFTATLGERASVPFWIANKAAHFNEKKSVSIVLQNSYNFAAGFKPLGVLDQSPLPFLHRLFPCRNQSPIFAGDDSTPPMGYSVRHTLRAKNWTELCARFLRIFRASTIPEIRAIRDKFPIHHFKAETRIEDVMKSVVEARVDSRGRTRAAAAKQRASEGISQIDPRRPVSREPGPNDEVRPERPHGVFVYVVDGRRARLLTELQMREHLSIVHDLLLYRVPRIVARLQEIGFEVEKTITGEDCYVGPDGIAYPSVVEAAAAVGAPQTVAGLFIVLAHYTLVPRTNELELLPPREQQQIRKTIRSAIVRASAGQTNTQSLLCLTDSQRRPRRFRVYPNPNVGIICGKPPEGGKGEFYACSAYLIETYSNDGHRGLCSNGAHVSCLNYYMRFNLIPGVRPVGAMFCSVLCQVRGVALKLRIVHHPDDPDILFVPQIEFPGALPAAMLLSTQITRPMRLADRRDLRTRLRSLGLSCDGIDALETPWSDYESKRHASHLLDAASLTWSAVSNEHADHIPAGLPPLPPPSLLPPPPAFEEHLEMLLDNDEPMPLPQEAQVPPVDGTAVVAAMSDDAEAEAAEHQQQHTGDVAAQHQKESPNKAGTSVLLETRSESIGQEMDPFLPDQAEDVVANTRQRTPRHEPANLELDVSVAAAESLDAQHTPDQLTAYPELAERNHGVESVDEVQAARAREDRRIANEPPMGYERPRAAMADVEDFPAEFVDQEDDDEEDNDDDKDSDTAKDEDAPRGDDDRDDEEYVEEKEIEEEEEEEEEGRRDIRGGRVGRRAAGLRAPQIRWTPDEHERFVAAVKKYDAKNWKLVAREVGNRTDLQCKNHYYRTYEAEYVAQRESIQNAIREEERKARWLAFDKPYLECDAWNHVYDLEGGTWELPSTVDPDVPIHQLSLEDHEASLDAYFAFEAQELTRDQSEEETMVGYVRDRVIGRRREFDMYETYFGAQQAFEDAVVEAVLAMHRLRRPDGSYARLPAEAFDFDDDFEPTRGDQEEEDHSSTPSPEPVDKVIRINQTTGEVLTSTEIRERIAVREQHERELSSSSSMVTDEQQLSPKTLEDLVPNQLVVWRRWVDTEHLRKKPSREIGQSPARRNKV
ncbi:hypothetical protein CTAYLR_008104 [Chrysophaeum taylorii]|uniref:Uncharacterized protein n=1 Tax=Chrysophaeum taylorii TaxID=2483200 RepID=A0AAD7XN33_9STRA|nr:hypothetical protein CTAYLR_008104 [Chrysophaeum taylorii]